MHEPVDFLEGTPTVANPIVVGPPFEVAVQTSDQFRQWRVVPLFYPRRANAEVKLIGFNEILPGLAFGVAPDENGVAQSLESLEKFLDEVLSHLATAPRHRNA